MIKTLLKFLLGLGILFSFYILSMCIIKLTHITMPPAILGLILFSLSLINGIIKEEWIKTTVEFLLKNMAILFVPFIGGLIIYQSVLLKNWVAIMLIVLLTTTITIVLTGLFVEYGIKYLRLYKMRKHND